MLHHARDITPRGITQCEPHVKFMEEKERVANIITCVQQNDAKSEIAKQPYHNEIK